ncbi:MAG TPA: HAMP domain-containing sensor histidine kinase [Solirubrobacteraceae bacterium]|nr:HAMP domain-containing sensor histidine kinase [Solirubrobacteraceae bacterium]
MKRRLGAHIYRLRHPRTTVRWRLTLLYGGMFLVCGTALLAITYGLVAHATGSRSERPFSQKVVAGASSPLHLVRRGRAIEWAGPGASVPPEKIRNLLRTNAGRAAVQIAGRTQRGSDLHKLEVESAIALAIMTILSGALGWFVAGRVLAPVRTMIETTQEISETNLHRRLAVAGPPDELRTLAGTIDGLLARLEGAFDAQRRFAANASHELRTPLATSRALLEMVTSDPAATVADFRRAAGQALEESERQEQLIGALLSFAQGQQGLGGREPVRLDEVAATAIDDHSAEAASREVTIEHELAPATVAGDPRLIERLASNLVANAVRHNVGGGIARVSVAKPADLDPDADAGAGATLRISNTGPIVHPDQIERMLAPFGRLDGERIGHGDGFGLGLSIVSAIADAHDAALTLTPRDGGGLDVDVHFPAPVHAQRSPGSERPPTSERFGIHPSSRHADPGRPGSKQTIKKPTTVRISPNISPRRSP